MCLSLPPVLLGPTVLFNLFNLVSCNRSRPLVRLVTRQGVSDHLLVGELLDQTVVEPLDSYTSQELGPQSKDLHTSLFENVTSVLCTWSFRYRRDKHCHEF